MPRDLRRGANDGEEPDNTLSPPAPLKFDPERYRHCLAEADLIETEETQVLERLWAVACSLVDLTFGGDAVRLVQPELGDAPEESGPAFPTADSGSR